MPKSQKILLISRNFPPLVGGIESLMHSTFLALRNDYDVILVGPRGCKPSADDAFRVYALPVNIVGFVVVAACMLPMLLIRYRPKLAIGSNGLMSPLLVICAKLGRVRTVCFLHGLDIIAKSKLYRCLFLPAARLLDGLIVNSSNTKRLALENGFNSAKLHIVHPCIKEAIRPSDTPFLADRLPDHQRCLIYAGRIVPRKGLLEFIEYCSTWLRTSDSHLVVAGDSPFGQAAGEQAVEYVEQLASAVKRLNLESCVTFLGRVTDEDMAEAFNRADIHVMPLIDVDGDVEGFGMVAVEAASYGTPTVAFDCGGVSDAVPSADFLVKPGDYAQLMRTIDRLLESPPSRDGLKQWAGRFQVESFKPALKLVLAAINK